MIHCLNDRNSFSVTLYFMTNKGGTLGLMENKDTSLVLSLFSELSSYLFHSLQHQVDIYPHIN